MVSIGSLIGDPDRDYEPPTGQTPETIFMKQWAVSLVDGVLRQLQEFYEGSEQRNWYELFALTQFTDDQSPRLTQHELAERFGLTRDQVRYALEMVQKRFVHLLRKAVADQVASEEEVSDEIRDLLALLGR